MSDYPMLISNKLHSFRNFYAANILLFKTCQSILPRSSPFLDKKFK